MTEEQKQPDLIKLQDDIYRDQVLRARAMTPEQRLEECFELTNEVHERMLEGAMWQKDIIDINEGRKEVARRIERLRYAHDYNDPHFLTS